MFFWVFHQVQLDQIALGERCTVRVETLNFPINRTVKKDEGPFRMGTTIKYHEKKEEIHVETSGGGG